MNNKVDLKTRLRFRDWLRDELKQRDFWQRRGDHYLIREYAKYCVEMRNPIDEASLGRYLRDDDPVLPTPERCRALARVFEYPPVRVLIAAGYLEGNDLFTSPPHEATANHLVTIVAERKAQISQLAESVKELAALVATVEPTKRERQASARDERSVGADERSRAGEAGRVERKKTGQGEAAETPKTERIRTRARRQAVTAG